MSNARYFADGVDFWRVVFDTGAGESIDGPYVKPYAAKRVGEAGIKTRKRFDYRGNLLHEWQQYKSYRIQKLVPVPRDCDFEKDPCIPALCFGGHPYELRWMDVES